MTEKQRLKHERNNANKPLIPTSVLDFNDIVEPKMPPRLSWLNAKTHAGFADRKHKPGRKPEHLDAVYEYSFVKETKVKEQANDQREDQAIDRAENEGMGAGTQRPE